MKQKKWGDRFKRCRWNRWNVGKQKCKEFWDVFLFYIGKQQNNAQQSQWELGDKSTRSFCCRILICIVRLGVALAAGLFVVNFKVGEFFYGHQQSACQLQRFFFLESGIPAKTWRKPSLAQFGNFWFILQPRLGISIFLSAKNGLCL